MYPLLAALFPWSPLELVWVPLRRTGRGCDRVLGLWSTEIAGALRVIGVVNEPLTVHYLQAWVGLSVEMGVLMADLTVQLQYLSAT